MAAHRLRSLTVTALRAAVGITLAAFLIYFVLSRNDVDFAAELRRCILPLLAIPFGAYFLVIGTAAYRWHLLLKVQGIDLPARELISLTMIGTFFSLAIPGTVSGDLVKMAFLTPHVRDRMGEAMLTIMLDRIFGIFGLFIVALLSALLSLRFLLDAAATIQLATVIVGSGSIAGMMAILAVRFRERLEGLPGVRHAITAGARHLPLRITNVVGRLSTALNLYRRRSGIVAVAVLLSVGTHSVFAASVFVIGKSFREEAVALPQYFLATLVANTIASIPLTPAGLGGRDLVLAAFLDAAGADAAKAGIIPAMLSIVIASVSLTGGFFFITYKFRRPEVV